MSRVILTLVALSLLAPLAAAAPDAQLPAPDARPTLPDLAPMGAAVAKGASTAARATGDALAALSHGIASVASAAGRALTALGDLLASAAAGLGAALAALFAGLGHLASLLASALGRGARFAAAHPKESAIVAGSASGLGLLAYAAKKWWLGLFVPLYSRLAKSDMLSNQVRHSVFTHIQANPGAHPSAIADTLGIGWGTVVYHLARLEESSLVTTRTAHHRKCYFVVGGDLSHEGRTAVAAMATDKARLIVDALRGAPGLSQKALAEKLGMSQALASWHVKRLVASGILVSTRDGRSNLLHVAEHVPVMAAQPVAALAA